MKNSLDGGEAVVEAFRNLGIKYVIASPGSEWAPVWEAFARQEVEKLDGPTYLDCWHETLAVNMATGYTLMTGEPQAVLLHTGVGLLQGSMGVHGAQRAEVPMIVMSGESVSYGENPDIEPGAQWYRGLSTVGGTHRLAEPFVKWAGQVPSTETLYESVVRTTEISDRVPKGPTYLAVPLETLLEEWVPPKFARKSPAAPAAEAPDGQIAEAVEMLAKADNPIIVTESAGQDAGGFKGLKLLAEALAVPVIDSGAVTANFDQTHPMHQGTDLAPFREDTDLALVVRARAPWYPPSNRPPNAAVIAIDENPLRDYMVYQALQADLYLEGDVGSSLTRLTEAVLSNGADKAKIDARRERLTASHTAMVEQRRAAEAEAMAASPIDPIWLLAALRENLPDDTIYIDETILHQGIIKQHLEWQPYQSYISTRGGLGQGLGTALGVKLARPDRPVVALMGDGAFLYNPITQSLGAARDHDLPILIVVFNNKKYSAMKGGYDRYYPDGVALKHDSIRGVNINGPDYAELVQPFGGFGVRVDDPADLPGAIQEALAAVNDGRTAIVNVDIAW